MNEYPEEVQARIDVLDNTYEVDDSLMLFNIIHMYPLELACPNGFYDSMFFNAVGYGFENMKKRNLGRHDGLIFDGIVSIDIVRIFADGSTLLRFKNQLLLPVRFILAILF
jgi:hypothetical protein